MSFCIFADLIERFKGFVVWLHHVHASPFLTGEYAITNLHELSLEPHRCQP